MGPYVSSWLFQGEDVAVRSAFPSILDQNARNLRSVVLSPEKPFQGVGGQRIISDDLDASKLKASSRILMQWSLMENRRAMYSIIK